MYARVTVMGAKGASVLRGYFSTCPLLSRCNVMWWQNGREIGRDMEMDARWSICIRGMVVYMGVSDVSRVAITARWSIDC